LFAITNILFSMGIMARKVAGDTLRMFRKAADGAGLCPAAALLDPSESQQIMAADRNTPNTQNTQNTRNIGNTLDASGESWRLPKRQMLECVCAGASVGGQSLLECLLRAKWESGAFSAVIDAAHALDPASLDSGLGERLLWVQVAGAKQLVRALDLLLRDDNFALVAADLRGLPAKELQAIQPFSWYRLQRLAHQRAGGCVIFSDLPSVRCADQRMLLAQPRSLDDLDRRRIDLLSDLEGSVRLHNRGQVLRVVGS
jgi:hypothetical protein